MRRRANGFTMVELLVSITVLSIMLLALATMMNLITTTWVSGIGAVDNFTKARVVLTLLDRDIQMMVMRRDIAAFVDGSGNSACTFYTNIQGAPGSGLTAGTPDLRAVSLVQYLLANPTTQPTLQRLNSGMNFLSTTGATPLIGSTTSLPAPSNSSSQTENVFTGIVQFQFQFIDGTGAIQTPPYTPTSAPPASSSPPVGKTPFWFDYAVPGASYNPRVVVVSMVVMSNAAYNLAIQSGTLAAVVNDFPATAAALPANTTYAQYWDGILNPGSGNFGSGLPPAIRGGIQVFERHIPLPVGLSAP